MALGQIGNINFLNIEAQRYWSFPSSYSTEKRRETMSLMLNSNNYIASEKRDGYWQMVIKDDEGNFVMRARSAGVNGWVCKQDWVPHLHPFFNSLPNGTCLIGEIYIPGGTSKMITTILGCGVEKAIQRQAETKLRYSVFDVIAWKGEDISAKPIVERIKHLSQLSGEYVDVVTYWDTPADIHENWLRILSEGGEGVVLTHKNNPYEFGKRTAKHTLKLKKELQENLDVFLTGRYKVATKLYTGSELATWQYWYDEVTGKKIYGTPSERIYNNTLTPVTRLWYLNMAASIEVATIIDGKMVPIGWISGITDDDRVGIVDNPESYRGKVVELQAMEIDNSGATPTLRHAKIVRWRDDKNFRDCVWSK